VKLTLAQAVEGNGLVQGMLQTLASLFSQVAVVREFVQLMMTVSADQLNPPATRRIQPGAICPLTCTVLGSAEGMLEQLLTTLNRTSEAIVPDPDRKTMLEAIAEGRTTLAAARCNVTACDLLINNVHTRQALERTEALARVIGRILYRLQAAVLEVLLAEPETPPVEPQATQADLPVHVAVVPAP
jgi:hypothetical protein